jgi:hypothetical protein
VRDLEGSTLIATTETYVLPLEMYVLLLDDVDTRQLLVEISCTSRRVPLDNIPDVVKFMLLLDKAELVCEVNPLIVPGRTICEVRDWLSCAVDATMLLLEDVEDSKSELEDEDVLLCTGAVPVVEARVTELPLPIVDAGATKLPVPDSVDSVYSVCVWL